MNKPVGLAVIATVVALTATACGSKPVSTSGSTSSANAGGSFKACMVTDTGGLDDHSFNAESWAGMQDAAKANPNINVQNATSATENDYASNIAGFVSAQCKLIVTVGFAMNDATVASAKKNTSQHYAIVDNTSTAPQIKGLEFNTAQGAFLGGYFAAGMTKTGKVATFGGANYPTVTVYMDGFWEGVQYYNQKHGTHVQVLGWDEPSQHGTFDPTQSFTDQAGGKQIAATFQSEGADIVFPVAGGTGIGALAQAQSSGGKLNAIWVDDDGFVSNPQYGSVIMTSVTKGIATAVSTSVQEAANGQFSATPFVGTLSNNGTGLAPYHDFASKVPASLTSEINTVKANIINGTIKIQSKNQPTAG
ncbi:BMP family ABC transporter substrate-binding protein [Streptacidiphilus pinicola]|uniref:BMP family ABC transporter substrate-binding protein n=1 Tax=Streptacidiphilus pinicola TaxID=2219663 RepID=A0A2X0IKX6_9ACTN|nr:BMP family ABC transporter substrate-binding protein [Streptacidiphilus pinicola]RAG84233.1 BMP family ABC transporter substrate-binding protein [Streptacidiphilus pinicola]